MKETPAVRLHCDLRHLRLAARRYADLRDLNWLADVMTFCRWAIDDAREALLTGQTAPAAAALIEELLAFLTRCRTAKRGGRSPAPAQVHSNELSHQPHPAAPCPFAPGSSPSPSRACSSHSRSAIARSWAAVTGRPASTPSPARASRRRPASGQGSGMASGPLVVAVVTPAMERGRQPGRFPPGRGRRPETRPPVRSVLR